MKAAVEQLTGGRCYHMVETDNPGHVELWHRVLDGEIDALGEVLGGYVAAVDFPASMFWRELAAANPGAAVVLSTRRSADVWWESCDRTVWAAMRERRSEGADDAWTQMAMRLMERFASNWSDRSASIAAHDAHVAEVRATIAADRLVEMTPEMGWAPLCEALALEVPDDDYPRRNDSASFRQNHGWD